MAEKKHQTFVQKEGMFNPNRQNRKADPLSELAFAQQLAAMFLRKELTAKQLTPALLSQFKRSENAVRK